MNRCFCLVMIGLLLVSAAACGGSTTTYVNPAEPVPEEDFERMEAEAIRDRKEQSKYD